MLHRRAAKGRNAVERSAPRASVSRVNAAPFAGCVAHTHKPTHIHLALRVRLEKTVVTVARVHRYHSSKINITPTGSRDGEAQVRDALGVGLVVRAAEWSGSGWQ